MDDNKIKNDNFNIIKMLPLSTIEYIQSNSTDPSVIEACEKAKKWRENAKVDNKLKKSLCDDFFEGEFFMNDLPVKENLEVDLFFANLTYYKNRIKKKDTDLYSALGMSKNRWMRFKKAQERDRRIIQALMIILHLSLDEAIPLYMLANYSFNPFDATDRIIYKHLKDGNYNFTEIDCELDALKLNTLFSDK